MKVGAFKFKPKTPVATQSHISTSSKEIRIVNAMILIREEEITNSLGREVRFAIWRLWGTEDHRS